MSFPPSSTAAKPNRRSRSGCYPAPEGVGRRAFYRGLRLTAIVVISAWGVLFGGSPGYLILIAMIMAITGESLSLLARIHDILLFALAADRPQGDQPS